MNGPRLILVLAAGFVAALALGGCLGCGGGDNSPEITISSVPTETQGALSKAAFIQEADAICEEANKAIAQFVDQGQGLSAAGEIADLREGVANDMKDLGLPAEDRTTAEQVIEGYAAQAAAGKKIALALDRSQDTTSAEAELDSAKSDTSQAAASYGFKECGQEPNTSGTTTSSSSGGGGGVTPSAPVTPTPVTPAPTPPSGGGTGGTGGGGGGVSPG